MSEVSCIGEPIGSWRFSVGFKRTVGRRRAAGGKKAEGIESYERHVPRDGFP